MLTDAQMFYAIALALAHLVVSLSRAYMAHASQRVSSDLLVQLSNDHKATRALVIQVVKWMHSHREEHKELQRAREQSEKLMHDLILQLATKGSRK